MIWTDVRSPSPSGGLRESIRNGIVKWAVNRAAAVLSMGSVGSRQISELAKKSVTIVDFPYVVSVSEKCATDRQNTGPLQILLCGRLVENKNFERTLQLLGRARSSRGLDFRVTIAGEGPRREHLETLVESLALQDVVDFTGWVDNDAVRKAMRRSHIFIHLPTWEPYGVVILEAMAEGMVVLASDTTMAAVDRITSGHNGFIFDSGNDDDVLGVIARLDHDRAELLRMGESAWRTACEQRPEAAASRISVLLEQVDQAKCAS